MSIENSIRLIHRVEKMVSELKENYSHHSAALLELNKLSSSLKKLLEYLSELDQLKPNYNTNEINSYFEAINLHLDILKVELEKKDYAKLQNGIKAISIMLKFHPTKYNFFTFIIAWLLEWIYFI
jgi:hypothetical protein